jgi:signal transduction histidine kinase
LPSDAAQPKSRCWELIACTRHECEVRRDENLFCWLADVGPFSGNGFSLAERLSERCVACPVFRANRDRALGKRRADRSIIATLDAVFSESLDLSGRVRNLEAHAGAKSRQVELLSEVGKALQSTMDIDRLLLVILTAVTAGNGLGFNRAFLMLVDKQNNTVRGRTAVGPADVAEADGIWKAMEKEGKNLGSVLSALSRQGAGQGRGIIETARGLELPLDASNIVGRSIIEGESFIVRGPREDPGAGYLARALGSDQLIIVPLVAEGERLGAILADNFVTGRDITGEDRRILETFASQAALALLNASLHNDLRSRLEEIHAAHEDLRQKHLQILRAQTQVALGGLTSTLIHDLRAPLVSIGLMARSAAADLGKRHRLRARLEQISEKTLEVEQYLETVGRSARTVPGRDDTVDIESVIGDALGLLRGLMLRLAVKADSRFHARGAFLKGSAVELRQMILNLVQNAVEAMSGGGTVIIETAREKDLLRIDIKDTGPGIPADLRPRVFSAFFTTKSEGLGLGLFSVKRIVNEYGGRIELQSEEGKGTCFTVLLPLGNKPAASRGPDLR